MTVSDGADRDAGGADGDDAMDGSDRGDGDDGMKGPERADGDGGMNGSDRGDGVSGPERDAAANGVARAAGVRAAGGVERAGAVDRADGPDRLPPIPPSRWTDAQRRVVEAIVAGPRGALIAPFVPLLRSPELTDHAQRMGEYLRYRSRIGLRLSELAILVTSHHWAQPVEWAIHAPIALREGVSAETIDAIRDGRRPRAMQADEAEVHDFCVALHRDRRVPDPLWAAVVARHGEAGAIDLIGVAGYYAFLAMVMNAARTPMPSSDANGGRSTA